MNRARATAPRCVHARAQTPAHAWAHVLARSRGRGGELGLGKGGLRRLAIAVVCAGVGAGGCGPGSSTGETRSPIVMDTFVSQLAAAMCGWQFRCCALPEIEGDSSARYLTESDCRTVLTQTIAEELSEARIGIETNHLSFDSTVAAACVQTFTEGACNPVPNRMANLPLNSPLLLWARYASCPNPFIGQLPTGSECFLPTECASGQSCTSGGDAAGTLSAGGLRAPSQLGDNMSTLRGHCQPDGQPGTPCASSLDCAAELYCRAADSVCAKPAAEGDACDSGMDSFQNPTFPVACADSPRALRCGGGHCHRLPQVGEPCLLAADTSTPPCDLSTDASIVCVGAGVNGTGVCQRPGQVGDACAMSSEISPSAVPPCAGSLACLGGAGSGSATDQAGIGHCAPPPVIGAPCGLDQRCAAPGVCYLMQQGDTGECALPGKSRAGAACTSDFACTSLVCRSDSGDSSGAATCVPGGQAICAGSYSYVVQSQNMSGLGSGGVIGTATMGGIGMATGTGGGVVSPAPSAGK